MNLLTRKRRWGLAALTAATCAVVAIGLSQATSSAATKITLTEEDYFNTPARPPPWPPTTSSSRPRTLE